MEYTYNGLGKQATMTTFKDANTPQVTSWTYNARGEMVQKTYADGNSVNYTYNADGQLLTRTWARGIVTTYTYDNAGRATGYSYSDGVTPAVAITLDFLDRQSSITDAAGTRSFTYNANNQPGNETNPSIMNGMITYAYDNAGRRTGMNLSNGTDSFAQANYTYDTRGRIATVGNNTDTLTYTYIPGTNMIGSAAWQNASINTVNTYDQYKRLTNIAVNGVNVYGYTLNDKNQRTSATLPDGNKWNYTYDVMGQLTGAVKQDTANNSLANMNYFYDLIGNRTSATENSVTTTYASNLVNQYTAVNAVVPVYDLDGNMTSYNGWTYTYNGENRLIVAENAAAGVRVEADYDYMGRRLFKKVYNNNTLTKHSLFVYDGFKQIAEFDALNNNSLKANYLWQPVGLGVVLLRNSEYLIADGNKNIIQVCNATGSVTDSYVYDPFGKVTHNGGSENPFQFSSEFLDSETELVYYNYRYYMPELGRWINRDPIEELGSINLYNIGKNNVLCHVDIYGLAWYNPFDYDFFIWEGAREVWNGIETGWQYLTQSAKWTGKQIGKGCVIVKNGIIKSIEYFFSDDALVVGWLTGPLRRIISGTGKLVLLNPDGVSDITDGVLILSLYVVVDVMSLCYGMTYGKYNALKDMKSKGFWAKLGDGILTVLIPTVGNYTGANWGTTQLGDKPFLPFFIPRKDEYAAFEHDKSWKHIEWIQHSLFKRKIDYGDHNISLVEPGPIGQSIRLVGIPFFILADLIGI